MQKTISHLLEQEEETKNRQQSTERPLFSEPASSLRHFEKQMQDLNGLFLISTPIGHLEDISLRALTALKQVDFLLCEDTRQTQCLLQAYGLSQKCISFHQHNQEKKLPSVLRALHEGKKIGLVSDRGTPMVSDPGDLLVHTCFKQHIPVHFLPGPCAAIMAVVLSGLSCQRFCFEGFLPLKKTREHLLSLKNETRTMVFFEAPHRIKKTLLLLQETWGDRKACLLREMTKKFEERIDGTISSLVQKVQEPRGEMVLVVEGATLCLSPPSLEEIRNFLRNKAHPSLQRQEIKQLAKELGCSAHTLYQEWITFKNTHNADED
jgi:16S rRNA (cytidine1402-2'-O)-methyltransferase